MRELKSYLLTLSNNIFLIVLPIVLLLMSRQSILFLAVYLIFMIYYFLKKRGRIFYIVVILSIIIGLSLYINDSIYDCNRYKNEDIEIEGIIIDKNIYKYEYSDSYRYTIKTRNIFDKTYLLKKKIYVYLNSEYKIGDKIKLEGVVKEIDKETIENGFDYYSYLNKEKIYLVINSKNSELINHTFSIHIIKERVDDYFSLHFQKDTLIIMKGLILGDSSGFSNELNEALKENGILHLFAVSGLHISLFISMLGGLLKLIKLKEELIEKIIIIFLGFYIILTSFSVSIVRASLMYFFSVINKRKFNKILSSLDVISITFITLILINPYFAYNTGFILSFLVSFIIVLVSSLLKEKSNAYQILVISILSNLFTLPIIININYEYNLLTPVINVLYITRVSSFILPFGFLTLVLPILSYAYDYVISIFIDLIKFTSNINLNIKMAHFNSLTILLFYGSLIALILFFRYKRVRRYSITILIIVMGYLMFFSSYTIKPKIDFLYLNDGDCTVIRYKNDVVVIDTGDGKNDEVLSFLLSKGIKKIDYLIITHAHDDHYGGVEGIEEKIRINNYVTSDIYKYNYKTQLRVKPFDEIKLDGINIIFLSPKTEYNNENCNSLTCLIRIKNKTMLFLADAEIEAETEIRNALNKLNIKHLDLIKIAHHGSDTSTSEELIQNIKIDYAVIMVGKSRKLTHPSSSVVNRLRKKEIKTYITTVDYSINVEIKNDSLVFNTLKK